MQNNTASTMAEEVINSLIKVMQRKVSSFQIKDLCEDVSHKHFAVECLAYNFFWVGIEYDKGRVGSYIINGQNIVLKSLSGWWEELELDSWIKELDREITLRIPDKYLKAKGWK